MTESIDHDERMRRRARQVLDAAGVDEHETMYTSTPTGTALLALLCNATAKREPSLYEHKSILIARALIDALRTKRPAWRQSHAGYGEQYQTDLVIYLDVDDIDVMAFHVRSDDAVLAELLTLLPWESRPWSGRQLQPIAADLARQYAAQRRFTH